MLKIVATYSIQRIIEVTGFDSVDDEGAHDAVAAASSSVVQKLEGDGWKVSTTDLESADEFEDDEDDDLDDEDDDEDDEDDEDDDEDDEGEDKGSA